MNEFKTITIKELINYKWFETTSNNSVKIRCYKTFKITDQDLLPNGFKFIDIENVRILIFFGAPKYADGSNVKIEFDNECKANINGPVKVTTLKDGKYTFIITPACKNGIKVEENVINWQFDKAVALLGAFVGRNAIFSECYENTLNIENGAREILSPVIENPAWFDIPNIKQDNLNYLTRVNNAIVLLHAEKKIVLNWVCIGLKKLFLIEAKMPF